MKKYANNFLCYVVALLIVQFSNSCHKESMSAGSNGSKHAPVADAGPDQEIILPQNTVVLDGTRSSDPENDIMDYKWTKISGPASFSILPVIGKKEEATVTDLIEGDYAFELEVKDATGLSSKDTTRISVLPAPPPPPSCDETGRPTINAQLVPFGTLSYRRYGMAVASAGNKLLFAGGGGSGYVTSRVDIYDLVTQATSTAELSVARGKMAAIAVGNKIFFAGGESADGNNFYSTVDIYDVVTNSWSIASLSEPRGEIAAATAGNKVFFAGGRDGYSTTSSRVDIYDLSTNTWTTANLSARRACISAVTVNNQIYFAGGYKLQIRYLGNWPYLASISLPDIDIYNSVTNTWTTSVLNEPKAFFASIVDGNNIYWAGGYSSSGLSCEVEIRNPNTGATAVDYLFEPSYWTSSDGENAVLKDNKIVFFVRDVYPASENKFNIYDITTQNWSIGLLPVTIDMASIIAVNNTIYLAGSFIDGVYDPGVWKLEF